MEQFLAGSPPRSSSCRDNPGPDFMSRATEAALKSAWQCSPVKPMTKNEKQEKLAQVNKKPAAAKVLLKRPAAQPDSALACSPKKQKPAAESEEPRPWFLAPERLELVKKAGSKVLIKPTDKRNTYTSRAYNLGKQMAKEEDGSTSEMKLWAKVALTGASETWDQHKC